MTEQSFILEMAVRDYECDLQGVVNNAVYQHYLEHARHEFLKAHQVDFAELARQGINLMVVRAELDYRASLTSGDCFRITTSMEQISRLRFAFRQDIVHRDSGKVVLNALVTGTAVNDRGRPIVPAVLQGLLSAD